MSGFYGSSYDKTVQRTDDSKSLKLKTAYWTTKQAMITKFGRKQDQNIVASDADLDSKLELLKSVQTTCRDLAIWLARYQETVCYLSQAENEMGRFLKQHSLEDKTRAGKIMSAVGKALSHSAQQRLLLRSPLDRLQQEVKTFRQRAISDTVSTLKRMETSRTEYRGALLWMKNVSEELDPDTYKQLEKFRCVQSQVRKSKSTFDRLKIDSMQKIDLLSASRCNMLSHVLAAYQNSLLKFLEKTSRTMVAVAERFKGYQYYEFSVLKHLRPDSRKLAGRGDGSDDEDSTSSMDEESDSVLGNTGNEDADGYAHTPPNGSSIHTKNGYSLLSTVDESESFRWSRTRTSEVRSCALDSLNDANSEPATEYKESVPTEEELDRQLDELFRTDDTDELRTDEFAQFQSYQTTLSSSAQPLELLAGADGGVPAEHRDFLTDLFATNSTSQPVDDSKNWFGQLMTSSTDPNSRPNSFTSEWNSVFGQLDNNNNNKDNENNNTASQSDLISSEIATAVTECDPWSEFERNSSSVLPSQLLDQRQQQQEQQSNLTALSDLSTKPVADFGDPQESTSLYPINKTMTPQTPDTVHPVTTGSASSKLGVNRNPNGSQQPRNLDAWISLFSDLDPLGNPDSLSKKEGQISDA
ncbi:Islet cell autoantigen 1 [Fasciola gigantica]|uniref:Islet cell autoantigen 1 n=1 Tax=Fasciola gigantica TaxID=46835 RepID=A0A504YZP3_FASGI|nr:Islet cell autoantigen 1 [Fasciola gigantica]